MLSKQDLLNGNRYTMPIGSRKGILNKPTILNTDTRDLFKSQENTNKLINELYSIYTQNGGNAQLVKFKQFILLLQEKFVLITDFNSYKMAEYQAVMMNDYTQVLLTINNDFHKFVYKYFRWNTYNPFHDSIEIGSISNRQSIKSSEIMAEDHGTLDLWRNQIVQAKGSNFLGNNSIPAYRVGMHTRNYDRDNEGFQAHSPDRASLENLVLGYDMSRVNDTVCNYSSTGWYSF